MQLSITVDAAYGLLYKGALIWLGILIGFMLLRSVLGPRITDRILAINMIGTMVISCICILSRLQGEAYLGDVALLYAMISFLATLIFATIYIPTIAPRGKYYSEVEDELNKQKEREKILVSIADRLDLEEEFDSAPGEEVYSLLHDRRGPVAEDKKPAGEAGRSDANAGQSAGNGANAGLSARKAGDFAEEEDE